MLQCLMIAGSIFLFNGEDVVRHDQIWQYSKGQDYEGNFLLAERSSGRYDGSYTRFSLAPDQASMLVPDIIAGCIADAVVVAPSR